MDELKLKLSTNVMRGLVAKLISKTIRSQVGYEVDIQLNEIEVKMEDGRVRVHVNVEAETTTDDFTNIIKSIGLK